MKSAISHLSNIYIYIFSDIWDTIYLWYDVWTCTFILWFFTKNGRSRSKPSLSLYIYLLPYNITRERKPSTELFLKKKIYFHKLKLLFHNFYFARDHPLKVCWVVNGHGLYSVLNDVLWIAVRWVVGNVGCDAW